MSPRSVVAALAFAAMVYAGASVLAKPKASDVYQCCSDQSECNSGYCCDAESIGEVACGTDGKTGYCLSTCRPLGGG